jgi:hypothetical protein
VKKVTQPDYLAYLLRLWRDGDGAPWRASLENTSTGEAKPFAEIRMLTAYLEHITGEAPPEGPPTTKPRNAGPEV